MKKKLLGLLSLVMTSMALNAQIIPNGGFENWTTTNFDKVIGADFTQNATKSSDHIEGNFAVKLENPSGNGNNVGVVLFGHAGNSGISGGVPYTGSPDSLVFYAKYDIKQNDAGLIMVFFWNGLVPTQNMFQITGNSNNQFVRLAFPVNHGVNVDSVALGFTSGDFTNTPVPGSWAIIDNAMFVGTNATQLSNSNFENWSTSGFEDPNAWLTGNASRFGDMQSMTAEKSTDAHSGTYSVKITSAIKNGGNSNNNEGYISNYEYIQNGQAGGFPFSHTVDTLVGYYKYTPVGNDTASINLSFKGNGLNGQSYTGITLPAANNYTYFQIPINIMQGTPDSILIRIDASVWPYNHNSGSVLYLDDLALQSDVTTGVKTIEAVSNTSMYPNPFQNHLWISFSSETTQNVSVEIYSMEGKLITSSVINSSVGKNLTAISTENLSAGIYQYVLKGDKGIISSGNVVK